MHGILYIIVFSIPLLFLLLLFTPQQLIEGIILRQTHRGFDATLKLSLLLFLGFSFIYLFAIKKWNLKNEKILYLVMWVLLILIPLMAQGRTFPQHFVYISYPLAILSSYALHSHWEIKRKTITTGFIAFSVVLSLFFIATAPRDISYEVSDEIQTITTDQDIVISGNPLVNVISNRLAPPNLTNLAAFHYPPVTLDDIIYWLEKNETTVIIVYYHLRTIEGVTAYLENSSSWQLYTTVEGDGTIRFEEFTPIIPRETYEIYIKT
jgi:hypothetical protein